MPDANSEALAAIYEYAAQRLVFFVPGDKRAPPRWVSSGTVLVTPNGRVVLLTAAHCARDAEEGPIRLGYRGALQAVQDAVAGVAYHPDRDVDVALLVLKPDAAAAVRQFAVGLGSLAREDVSSRDALVLAGFPVALSESEGKQRRWFTSVTYGTALDEPTHDERGRYRVQWTSRVTPNGDVEMPLPHGISGGALWRFRVPAKDELWSPTTTGRVAGVPVSWLKAERVVYAEPMARWLDWVIDTFAKIDTDV